MPKVTDALAGELWRHKKERIKGCQIWIISSLGSVLSKLTYFCNSAITSVSIFLLFGGLMFVVLPGRWLSKAVMIADRSTWFHLVSHFHGEPRFGFVADVSE